MVSDLSLPEVQRLVMELFAATQMHGADPEERASRRKVIGESLMTATPLLAEAEEIISRAKRSFDEFPTVRQFEHFVSTVLAELRPPKDAGHAHCPMCHGTGFARATASGSGVFVDVQYSAVRRCTCLGDPDEGARA